jgi:hypothetical protein
MLSEGLFFHFFVSCGAHIALSPGSIFNKYLIGWCRYFLLVLLVHLEMIRPLFVIILRMVTPFLSFFRSNSPNALHNPWWFWSASCSLKNVSHETSCEKTFFRKLEKFCPLCWLWLCRSLVPSSMLWIF